MLNLITQLMWLSLNTYHEARGESEEGQIAVCHVVLNRMHEDKATIEAVVKAPHQFSWVNDNLSNGIDDVDAFARCVMATYRCLDQRAGGYTLDGANHYYNPSVVSPKWAEKMEYLHWIGNHKFFFGPRGSGSGLRSYKAAR